MHEYIVKEISSYNLKKPTLYDKYLNKNFKMNDKLIVGKDVVLDFGNERLKLFEDFSQLDVCLAKNDKSDRDSAYFIEHLNSVDTRSYIGYIDLDEPADRLSYMQMPINTIGATDNSINYKLSDDDGAKSGICYMY